MAQQNYKPATNNFPAIRAQLTSPEIKKQIMARIGEKAGTFITSVLDLVGSDNNLQKCEPMLVVKEALKAAGLDLPVSKTLGFAYVIPYKNKQGQHIPQFQLGYKGYIQLAIRTGQYKHLNAGEVYEGETMQVDRIKGTLEIVGNKTSDKVIGYFAYMELVNGFEKAIALTRKQVEAHAKRFSKSYGSGYDSPWKSDFDAMAKKTMILQLIPKYGPMTIEMTQALENDRGDFSGFETGQQALNEIENEANQGEVIEIKKNNCPEETKGDEISDEEKAEILRQEQEEAAKEEVDPGF